MRGWLAGAAVLLLTLSGCAKAPTPATPGAFDDGLLATDTTGILRGLVVDTAIRPLGGATVTIQRPGGEPLQNVTDKDGSWGFGSLAPGTYAVTGTLARHVPTQTIAHVLAGEDEPLLVKLVLEPDLEAQPFVRASKFNGFMECGVRGGTGGASCRTATAAAGSVSSDRSTTRFAVENGPQWVQGEMLWKSSQPLADQMGFYVVQYEEDPAQNHFMGIYPLNMGKSPLLLAIDSEGVGHCRTCIEKPLNMSAWAELQLTAMAGEMDRTTPPPTCSPTGSPCLAGVGVVTNQQFDIFLHLFYRALPEEGWRFSEDGEPRIGGP